MNICFGRTVHRNSIKLMRWFRDKYLQGMKGCTVLDIGSIGKSATYGGRVFFPDYKYIGMDIVPGRNVTIVGYDNLPVCDVVISGQVMEHVKRPWEWLKNLVQYYTKFICIIAPNTCPEHRFPFDTYRYFPDGMRDLFEYAGIREIEINIDGNDTIGVGGK